MTNFNVKDHYFIQAKIQGFKARSVFKLAEIDEAHKLIRPNSLILDLGSAPGSWLQYVSKRLGPHGYALGVDITPIEDHLGPRIVTITENAFALDQAKLAPYLPPGFSQFDIVLSDMAPKTSGIKHLDQLKSFELAERAYQVAEEWLKAKGHVVIKVFNSGEVNGLIKRMKQQFKEVKQVRPKSIRSASTEFYIVGLHKKT